MRGLLFGILVLSLILIAGGVVLANERAYIPVTARIPQMIIMELDATDLVFDEEDFDFILGSAYLTKAGVMATKKRVVTATISGNVPYTLLISAPEEYLVGASEGVIHVSQLKWRLSDSDDDGDGWQSITLERMPVKSGPPGTLEVEFDFQFIAFWENIAQIYKGEILLTVIPDGS